jgi:hypothetical protein
VLRIDYLTGIVDKTFDIGEHWMGQKTPNGVAYHHAWGEKRGWDADSALNLGGGPMQYH